MSTVNLRRRVPAPTTGLVAKSGKSSVSLTWNKSDVSTDTYVVYQSTGIDFSAAVQVAEVTSNSYVVGGLTNGTAYYFWVKTKSRHGVLGPTGVIYDASVFQTLSANLIASFYGDATVRAQYFAANVTYYSNNRLIETGWRSFTSATQETPATWDPAPFPFTNPTNVLADDSGYAEATYSTSTSTSSVAGIISLPFSGAFSDVNGVVTNIRYRLVGRATNKNNVYFWAGEDGENSWYVPFNSFTVNNTYQTLEIDTNAQTFVTDKPSSVGAGEVVASNLDATSVKAGLVGGGYSVNVAAPRMASSVNGANTQAYGLGISGISSSVETSQLLGSPYYGTLADYGTWYSAQTQGIGLSGTFSSIRLVFNINACIDFSNVVCSSGQEVNVKFRIRLMNLTDSTEVSREFYLFRQIGTQVLAAQQVFSYSSPATFPNSSDTPLRLLPGKSYSIRFEFQKNRTGTDTITAYCGQFTGNYSFAL